MGIMGKMSITCTSSVLYLTVLFLNSKTFFSFLNQSKNMIGKKNRLVNNRLKKPKLKQRKTYFFITIELNSNITSFHTY